MRIEWLKMQGFGSYAKYQELNFTHALQLEQMFIISGKTGAGKTMIFDAIHYALYGQASGADRNERTLCSDFIDSGIKPYVELTFSIHNQFYTVFRSLPYKKPKVRGEGMVTESTKASLKMPDGTIYTKISEVNQEIEQILGLNAQQFKQLIMIPQGEFKKLLLATNQERVQIFRKIFGTACYEFIQDYCKEEALCLKQKIKAKQMERLNQIRQFHFQNTDAQIDQLMQAEEPNFTILFRHFATELQSSEKKIQELIKQIAEKNRELAIYNQKYSVVKQNQERFRQLDDYKKRLEELQAEELIWQKKKAEYQLAKRARKVYPFYQSAQEKKQIVQKQQQQLDKASACLLDFQKQLQKRQNLLRQAEKNQKMAIIYQSEKENVQRLKKKRQMLEAKQDQIQADQQLLDRLEQNIYMQTEKIRQETEKLHKQENWMKEVQQTKENLFVLQHAIMTEEKNFQQQVVLKDKLDIYNQKKLLHNKKQIRLAEVEQAYLLHKHFYEDLQMQYEKNLAGILAKQLVDHSPCPVCGATNHPNPAKIVGAKTDKVEINQAKAACEHHYQKWQQELSTLKSLYAEIQVWKEEIQILQEKMGDELTGNVFLDCSDFYNRYEQSEEVLQKLYAKQKQLQIALEAKPDLENEIKNQQVQIDELQISLTHIKDEQSAVQDRLTAANALCQAWLAEDERLCMSFQALEREEAILQEKLYQIRNNYEQVQNDFIALKGQYEKQKGIVESLRTQFIQAKQKADMQQKNYEEVRKREQFSDTVMLLAAYRTDAEFEQDEQAIFQYEKQLETITSLYQELKEQLITVQREEDVSAIERVLREAEEKLNELSECQNKQYARYKQNELIIKTARSITEEIQKEEAAYGSLAYLSQILNGKNRQNLSFERYVLRSYFEQIIHAANHRLKKMTQGRFWLKRKLEMDDKRKSQGLDLAVLDMYTGKLRDVSTLSGGESFKAALAMALGLSDVVQSFSGGMQMDMIFIDEGFGSLDEEALEMAIECLQELQAEGRIVGIISHVEALKSRIPVRLEVVQDVTGSHAKFVCSSCSDF